MVRKLTLTGLLLTATACGQESQSLPFDIEGGTTRSIPSEGGVVSAAAGASIEFPTGSLPATLTVTLAPAPTPGALEGTAASAAFSIEPSGMSLNEPASLELRLSPTLSPGSAWLASLAGLSGGVLSELPGGRVDLSTGILTTPIGRLGTFVAVVPPSSVVIPVQSAGSPALASAAVSPSFLGVSIDSVMAECGAAGRRCTGVTASASANLLDLVDSAALLYPVVASNLRIGATSVTGSMTARGTLRVLFESGRSAESVGIHVLLEPTAQTVATQTASELRLTHMRHRVSGGLSGMESAAEEIATLTIPLTAGSVGRVTVGRTFNIKVAGGASQPATVDFTFPVTVFE